MSDLSNPATAGLAALLSIGTELTRGELVNTNASWLAEELTQMGFDVAEHCTVDDDVERIADAIRRLARAHRIVVATGGLGPTSDDLTTAAAAQAVGVSLRREAEVLQAIRRKFESAGRTMPESNAKQADFPATAAVLPNDVGTAPGFAVTVGDARCYFLPGVPREMRHIYRESIRPEAAALAEPRTHQIHLRTFGMTESGVAEALADLEAAHAGLTLGYRAHFPEIEVKVYVRDVSAATAATRAQAIAGEVRDRLGPIVFGGRNDSFAAVVGRALRDRGLKLAVAESCTGGRIGAMLTAVPGSSDFLLLDAVVYADSAKRQVLGVRPETLRDHGAVSVETAAAMAEGALRVAGADIAVSTTGIAGPGGATPDKPAGTVWFGLARTGQDTLTHHRRFPWDRERVQAISAYVALELVRRAALE